LTAEQTERTLWARISRSRIPAMPVEVQQRVLHAARS